MGATSSPPMILVLGAVGVGKSTFIKSAGTKGPEPEIHHGSTPPRAAVEEFELQSNNGRTASLVDTPGFDHPDSHDRMVLTDIIKFLESRKPDQKVGGIIYLLDASSQQNMKYSADKMESPPIVVVATGRSAHDGDKPIPEALKNLLRDKYGPLYQQDHFGSTNPSEQYEVAWKIICRVLDANQGGVPVKSVIENLTRIVQNSTQIRGRNTQPNDKSARMEKVDEKANGNSFFRYIFCRC